MASGARLAIAISQSGAGPVEKALEGIAHTAGKLASAAASPIKALSGLGGALGNIAQTATGFALGQGLASLPGALFDMAQGAAADEQATARLSQTIRNLGGDFDGIMGNVNDAIAAGQKLAFTDDEVRDSFQFLAAATGDSEEAMKRHKIALDFARGANIPLTQATRLLGKVTDENVEAFKRMGITIGENASEADALAAIQAKFGGQAEAFANSTAGQFEQAKIAVAEIQESIGSALLPVLAKVGGVLSDNLPAIQEWVGAFAGGLAETIGPAVQEVWGNLQAFVMWLTSGDLGNLDDTVFVPWRSAMDAVRSTIVSLVDTAMAVLPDLFTAAQQAFSFFTTGSGDIEVFRGVLNRLLGEDGAQGVIHVFTNLTGFVQHDLIPAFQTAGQIVSKVLSGDLAGALSQVGEIVKAVAPQIASALVEWGRQFVAWVQLMWPPFQAELTRLWGIVLAYIQDQAPKIAAVLLQWGQEFVAWIGPMIPPFLAELGRVAALVLIWLGQQAVVLADKLVDEWIPAFVAWIVQMWPVAERKLGEFQKALGQWIVNDLAPWLWRNALPVGTALVEGIERGIAGLREWLQGKIRNMLSGALESAKRAMGISSPSRVWADEIGIPIMEGIILGASEMYPVWQATIGEMLDLTGPAFDDTEEAAREAGRRLARGWQGGFEEQLPEWDGVVRQVSDFVRPAFDAAEDVARAAGQRLAKEADFITDPAEKAKAAGEALVPVLDAVIPKTDQAAESSKKWSDVLGTEFPAAVAAAKEGPFKDLGELVDDIRHRIERAIDAWRDLQHRLSGGGSANPIPMPGGGNGPGPGGSGGPGAGVPGGFPGGESAAAAVTINQVIYEAKDAVAVTAATLNALARARLVSGVV